MKSIQLIQSWFFVNHMIISRCQGVRLRAASEVRMLLLAWVWRHDMTVSTCTWSEVKSWTSEGMDILAYTHQIWHFFVISRQHAALVRLRETAITALSSLVCHILQNCEAVNWIKLSNKKSNIETLIIINWNVQQTHEFQY
jgi:flagellar biosynthesis regulator FlaF